MSSPSSPTSPSTWGPRRASSTWGSPPPTSSIPPSASSSSAPSTCWPRTRALLAVLKRRAIEFKHTPTIGRTHGIHAEPTTFGLKLLNWYAEMERNVARFDAAAEDMRVGKLSGAVGTFGHLKPEHEERICERLGLKPAPVATQVIQRDRHAATSARSPFLAAPSTRSPSKSATCSGRRFARRRSTSAKSRRAPRRCRTRESDYVGADQRTRARSPLKLPRGA